MGLILALSSSGNCIIVVMHKLQLSNAVYLCLSIQIEFGEAALCNCLLQFCMFTVNASSCFSFNAIEPHHVKTIQVVCERNEALYQQSH